jgi:hypothetical protein
MTWRSDDCFPPLDAAVGSAFETLGVRGPRKGHAVLGAHFANLLQQAEFEAEYPDHDELLASSRAAKRGFHRVRASLASALSRELASEDTALEASVMAASAGSRVGISLAEGLAAQRRLDFIPAILQQVSYVAAVGERLPFSRTMADSGTSCSVLDEASAQQLVRLGWPRSSRSSVGT